MSTAGKRLARPGPLGFADAAAGQHDAHPGPGPLQLGQQALAADHLGLGVLAHGAGVDDDEVRPPPSMRRGSQPDGEELAGHLLGVALVHLAAERPDEEARAGCRASGRNSARPAVHGRRGGGLARTAGVELERRVSSVDRSWHAARSRRPRAARATRRAPRRPRRARRAWREPRHTSRRRRGSRCRRSGPGAARRQGRHLGHRRRVEAAVVDLQPAEPGLDQLADQVAPHRRRRRSGPARAGRRRPGWPRWPRAGPAPGAARRPAGPGPAGAAWRRRRSGRGRRRPGSGRSAGGPATTPARAGPRPAAGRRRQCPAPAGAATHQLEPRESRLSRWRSRAASKASSAGSTPRPRMCSSPSQRRSMPVATLLISTAGHELQRQRRAGRARTARERRPGCRGRPGPGPDARRRGGLDERARLQDAVGAAAVGVEIDARRIAAARPARPVSCGTRCRGSASIRCSLARVVAVAPGAGHLRPRRCAGCARSPRPGRWPRRRRSGRR